MMFTVRNTADYRSLLWIAVAILLVGLQYSDPAWVIYLSPISCYLAIACGTITHNQAHREMFSSRRGNQILGHVLTFFYGYPSLMWIPTHNMNHHRFANRPGDATATWRYTNRNNLLVALFYPIMSGYFQSGPIRDYLKMTKSKKPRLHRQIQRQYVLWIGFYLLMLALAGYLHHSKGTGTGLYVFFFAVMLPAVMSSTVIMVFNFIQHVHTDAWSENDHSRNFVGTWFNFLFFNNGYHTAHHDKPSLHWSELPAEHARIASEIRPELNERNLIWFFFRQYIVSLVFPSFGTKQIGTSPDSPQ